MASRDRSLRIEGILSFGALFVLIPSLLLVYWAWGRTNTPLDPVMVNEATGEKFASTLAVAPELAARIVDERTRLGSFESSDQLLEIPLFSRADADRLAAGLAASHLDPARATAGQLTSALKLSPIFARRLAAYRDSWLPLFPEEPGKRAERKGKGEKGKGKSKEPSLPVPKGVAPSPLPADWIRRAPLLDPQATRPLLSRFLVRSPGTVFRHFWVGVALLALIAFLTPPWLRHKELGGDPFLIPLAFLLTGLGIVMLFSIKDPLRDRAVYEHHLLGLIPAVIALLAFARLAPAARLRIKSYGYLWVFVSAALVGALSLFGSGPEGVKLNLFHFQPIEFIKILLVFFLAGYLADRADLIADASRRASAAPAGPKRIAGRLTFAIALPRQQDLGPIVVMFAGALLMFFLIKDLGPGLLLFSTFVVLLYLTTGRGGFVLAGMALILIGGVIGYYRHIGVFATRVDMWLSPFANAHPNGMQLGQSYWAMASGGMEGSGLGLGMPGLVPRAGSDLALASWAEETGLIGAWIVLVLYTVLVWRGLRIALRANNDFDRALAFGLATLFGLQTLLIAAGVTGAFPLTGIPLPFLSYGDSALVSGFAMIGLLYGISLPPRGGIGRPQPKSVVRAATRRFALAFTLLLLGGIGLWKLGHIQLLEADAIAVRPIVTPDADGVARPHLNPRLLTLEREIPRGSIYDRSGRVLATSRQAEIGKFVHQANAVERLVETRARYYPYGQAFAQLVGYVDPTVGGPSGLERGYDAELRGFGEYTELLADYRNRNLPGYRPRRGRDLHTTLDAALQRKVQELLWQTALQLKDKRNGRPKDRAAFVLMDPKTGAVIVAATIPTFDPNTLTPDRMRVFLGAQDADEEHRFINRAVYGVYPPGSTLKVATTACALDNLNNALNFAVVCNRVYPEIRWHAGGVTYVRRNTRDDKGDPDFGTLTLPAAFRVSSNIYFANLAVALGATAFRSTLIERMGFRHTPKQEYFDADLPDIGYGQGRMLASPLEMARLAAAAANNGKMMEMRLVTSAADPAGQDKKIVYTPASRQAMTPPTAATLRDLMRSVVTGGTARGVFDGLPFAVAGKTGTAQNKQNDREPHSWFVGFAPYASGTGAPPPRYAFACIVENGGYGKTVAAVICRNVLKAAF